MWEESDLRDLGLLEYLSDSDTTENVLANANSCNENMLDFIAEHIDSIIHLLKSDLSIKDLFEIANKTPEELKQQLTEIENNYKHCFDEALNEYSEHNDLIALVKMNLDKIKTPLKSLEHITPQDFLKICNHDMTFIQVMFKQDENIAKLISFLNSAKNDGAEKFIDLAITMNHVVEKLLDNINIIDQLSLALPTSEYFYQVAKENNLLLQAMIDLPENAAKVEGVFDNIENFITLGIRKDSKIYITEMYKKIDEYATLSDTLGVDTARVMEILVNNEGVVGFVLTYKEAIGKIVKGTKVEGDEQKACETDILEVLNLIIEKGSLFEDKFISNIDLIVNFITELELPLLAIESLLPLLSHAEVTNVLRNTNEIKAIMLATDTNAATVINNIGMEILNDLTKKIDILSKALEIDQGAIKNFAIQNMDYFQEISSNPRSVKTFLEKVEKFSQKCSISFEEAKFFTLIQSKEFSKISKTEGYFQRFFDDLDKMSKISGCDNKNYITRFYMNNRDLFYKTLEDHSEIKNLIDSINGNADMAILFLAQNKDAELYYHNIIKCSKQIGADIKLVAQSVGKLSKNLHGVHIEKIAHLAALIPRAFIEFFENPNIVSSNAQKFGISESDFIDGLIKSFLESQNQEQSNLEKNKEIA